LPQPEQEQENPPPDTSSQDSAVDTGEEPPCAEPEVEPNGEIAGAQVVEMEDWACGYFQETNDNDMMKFANEETGWMRVWVVGADRGSYADLQFYLIDQEEELTARAAQSPNSTDPKTTVPVSEFATWYATISNEQIDGYGEDYFWEFMASMTKQPVDDWTIEEQEELGSETNNKLEDAESIDVGDRVYGLVDDGEDRDWFVVSIPDGKSDVVLQVEAFAYGSPLNGYLAMYEYDSETGEADLIDQTNHGQYSSEADPLLSTTISDAMDLYILLKADDSAGSPLYWYVIDVSVDTTVDSGTPDTAGRAEMVESQR